METTAIQRSETMAMESPGFAALTKAIEKGVDTSTLSRLMDLQERWEANQARKAFVEAMAGFKRDCPAVIGKDRRADFGQGKAKYSYATTGQIVTAVTPHLSRYGLSLSWETWQEGKTVTVACHVTHAAGHRETATLTGPNDESGGKNPIQTVGSTVHYLQRYTMVSVLGLATADMDDPDETPAQRPVETTIETHSGDTITGMIEDVLVKTGTSKTGKPWTRYGIKVSGVIYGTFSETVGSAAVALRDAGTEAVLTVERDGLGHDNCTAIEAAGKAVQE